MELPHSIEDQQVRFRVPFQLRVVEMWVGRCSSLRRKIDVRTRSSFSTVRCPRSLYTRKDANANSQGNWQEIATHCEVCEIVAFVTKSWDVETGRCGSVDCQGGDPVIAGTYQPSRRVFNLA